MKTSIIIISVVVILLIASQLYLIMASTEIQSYRVIKTENDFEIRIYPPVIMASVTMKAKSYKELSSSGFKKLASFIFGANNSKANIAMTSPVHMDINNDQSSMSFIMPANYTRDNVPKPNDSDITIKTTDEDYVAAIQFGGFADDDKIKTYTAQLESALKANGIEYFGTYRYLGYNAPFQIVGRKNEIIVSVRWNKK